MLLLGSTYGKVSAYFGGSCLMLLFKFGLTYMQVCCNGSASCVSQKCASVFAGKPDLIAGCSWFTGWYAAADNPKVVYKQVSCPTQITSKTTVSG